MIDFEKWLYGRDTNLFETMSREKMAEDDLDALKAAHRQSQEEEELEEKVRAIKYLADIKKKLEKFVDSNNQGARGLKLIAAALLNHENTKAGIKSHVRHLYNKELNNLHSMQKVFSHDNLMKHLTELPALHALHLILTTDFADQIESLSKDPDFHKTDHKHGELGRKFTNFVVDHIKHAIDDILGEMLSGHKKEEEPKPEETPEMGGEEMGGEEMQAPPEAQMAPDMGGQPPMQDGEMGDEPYMGDDAQGDGEEMPDEQSPEGMQAGPDDENALMPPVGMGKSAGAMAPPPAGMAPPPAGAMAPPPAAMAPPPAGAMAPPPAGAMAPPPAGM